MGMPVIVFKKILLIFRKIKELKGCIELLINVTTSKLYKQNQALA